MKRCVVTDTKAEEPAVPAYDSALKQCRTAAGLLRNLTEALTGEQKAELADVIADIRAGAVLLGAM